MATIADNIREMAALVASVKKEYRLTETTVLRIVDMNFALAEKNSGGFNGELPEFGPEPGDEPVDGQLELFPEGEEETTEEETTNGYGV